LVRAGGVVEGRPTETSGDDEELSRPLSHAALVVRYLEGKWPAPG
jgi:hypothetical protein